MLYCVFICKYIVHYVEGSWTEFEEEERVLRAKMDFKSRPCACRRELIRLSHIYGFKIKSTLFVYVHFLGPNM